MKSRAIVGLCAAAGLASAASAQESIVYAWSFTEVDAGTNNPVGSPNNIIEPGEAARIELTATIVPGIGSTATYAPPPPPGAGTIAGLGSVFFDLFGSNMAQGTWGPFGRATGFALGGIGTPSATGENLTAGQAGQFVLPGSVANSTNPINMIWRGTWTPADYSARTVTFTSMAAAAAGQNHSSILIQYGEDPNTGDPLYIGRFIDGQFGNLMVPIIPAPASLMLLGSGALLASRRRR